MKIKTRFRLILGLYKLLYALHFITSSFLTWDKVMAQNRRRYLSSH